jgi:hypothetical protein
LAGDDAFAMSYWVKFGLRGILLDFSPFLFKKLRDSGTALWVRECASRRNQSNQFKSNKIFFFFECGILLGFCLISRGATPLLRGDVGLGQIGSNWVMGRFLVCFFVMCCEMDYLCTKM